MELINGASTFQFTLGFGAVSIAIWNEYVIRKSEFVRAVAALHSENDNLTQYQLATAETIWNTAMAAPLTHYLNVFVLISLVLVSFISFVCLTVAAIDPAARAPSSAFIFFSIYSIVIIPGMILFLRWLQRRILAAIQSGSATEYSKESFAVFSALREDFQTMEEDLDRFNKQLSARAERRAKIRQK